MHIVITAALEMRAIARFIHIDTHKHQLRIAPNTSWPCRMLAVGAWLPGCLE